MADKAMTGSDVLGRVLEQLQEAMGHELVLGKLDMDGRVTFEGLDVGFGYLAILTLPEGCWPKHQMDMVRRKLEDMIREVVPVVGVCRAMVLPHGSQFQLYRPGKMQEVSEDRDGSDGA